MKPDWKDAPEWANWLAMDEDRVWFWYERKPERNLKYQHWETLGRMAPCETLHLSWLDSLISRPETTKPAEAGSEGQGA